MTEAPIPMALPEALVIVEALRERLTDPRERRALEQLARHARQARRASSSTVDVVGSLVEVRRQAQAVVDGLTEAIASASGPPGAG